MRAIKETRVSFEGEGWQDGEKSTIEISYDNRGEPYRKGISVYLGNEGRMLGAFLEDREAIQVRDLLNALYPVKP